MAIPASISEFLDQHHARYSVLTHPVAYTAQEEAAAAHVPGREWAKVVVCVADDRPVLAVLPAPLKVDFERLRDVTHAHSLRLAHENEFKGLYTGFRRSEPCRPWARSIARTSLSMKLSPPRRTSSLKQDHIMLRIRMPYAEFQPLVRPTVAAFTMGSGSSRPRIAHSTVSDAVCGAGVSEESAWGWSEYGGRRYHFCSQACKMEFDDSPGAYTRANLSRRHALETRGWVDAGPLYLVTQGALLPRCWCRWASPWRSPRIDVASNSGGLNWSGPRPGSSRGLPGGDDQSAPFSSDCSATRLCRDGRGYTPQASQQHSVCCADSTRQRAMSMPLDVTHTLDWSDRPGFVGPGGGSEAWSLSTSSDQHFAPAREPPAPG